MRPRIEARFLKSLRGDEPPVPSRNARVLAKPVVVRRERPRLRRQKRTVDPRRVCAAIEKVLAIQAREQTRVSFFRQPLIECCEQLRRVTANRPDHRLRRTDGWLDDEVRILAA